MKKKKNIILYGPPGSGKTVLAKAIKSTHKENRVLDSSIHKFDIVMKDAKTAARVCNDYYDLIIIDGCLSLDACEIEEYFNFNGSIIYLTHSDSFCDDLIENCTIIKTDYDSSIFNSPSSNKSDDKREGVELEKILEILLPFSERTRYLTGEKDYSKYQQE